MKNIAGKKKTFMGDKCARGRDTQRKSENCANAMARRRRTIARNKMDGEDRAREEMLRTTEYAIIKSFGKYIFLLFVVHVALSPASQYADFISLLWRRLLRLFRPRRRPTNAREKI